MFLRLEIKTYFIREFSNNNLITHNNEDTENTF
jgi:hypothetical protein